MFDVGYFVRVFSLYWRHRGKKKCENIFKISRLTSRCWPNDLDTLFHMNNGRYLRECDFGRISLFMETGLFNALSKRRKTGIKNANIVVSALQTQYRQSIELGDKFKILTRINGWDDKAFYISQSMIIEKTNQTAFLLLVRLALIPRSLTPQMLIDDLNIGSIKSPELSPSIEIFKENYRLNFEELKSKL